MYYKKVETYSFSVPSEYTWYCDFKRQLEESGVKFVESGGNSMIEIQIVDRAVFGRENKDRIVLRGSRTPSGGV